MRTSNCQSSLLPSITPRARLLVVPWWPLTTAKMKVALGAIQLASQDSVCKLRHILHLFQLEEWAEITKVVTYMLPVEVFAIGRTCA